MTNQEIIEQLKSLKSHCEDFRNDEYCVWSKDVEALKKAIEALMPIIGYANRGSD